MFRRRLLPLAWAISSLGAIGLVIICGYYFLHNEWLYQYVGLAAALTVLPLVLSFVGWARGHTSDELEEP